LQQGNNAHLHAIAHQGTIALKNSLGRPQRMIRKSGSRFSEKIMRKQKDNARSDSTWSNQILASRVCRNPFASNK
jgi:hypothetical protein